MLNFELSRLVKQQCSNYLRSKYGALHTPTLQETSSRSYGHSQSTKKNNFMTQLLCVFYDSKPYAILVPLDLHLVKNKLDDINTLNVTTPI